MKINYAFVKLFKLKLNKGNFKIQSPLKTISNFLKVQRFLKLAQM